MIWMTLRHWDSAHGSEQEHGSAIAVPSNVLTGAWLGKRTTCILPVAAKSKSLKLKSMGIHQNENEKCAKHLKTATNIKKTPDTIPTKSRL